MNIFENVKASVTAEDAALFYGIEINRNHMARCIFHEDNNPSMKVDERFYCFGCGATGDAINLVAKLYGLRNLDAAKKIIADFHLDIESNNCSRNSESIKADIYPRYNKRMAEKEFHLWERKVYKILVDYY